MRVLNANGTKMRDSLVKIFMNDVDKHESLETISMRVN
jgi:hypothetical protein